MRRSNSPLRRLERSNWGSTTGVSQSRWGCYPLQEVCVCQAELPSVPLKVSNYLSYLSLFFNNFPFHSHSFACAGYIALKQWYVPHTNTNTLAMIPTYDRVLSAIEKALQELVEEC